MGTGFRKRREDLVQAYGDWLGHYQWDLFATLTFRFPQSRTAAQEKLGTWFFTLRQESGTELFRWVRVGELGSYGDHLHFHVLVGGLNTIRNDDLMRWAQLWRRIGGIPAIGRFDPKKKGIFYLLKTLLPDSDFDIQMHIPERGWKEVPRE